jgi:hypothetical protein
MFGAQRQLQSRAGIERARSDEPDPAGAQVQQLCRLVKVSGEFANRHRAIHRHPDEITLLGVIDHDSAFLTRYWGRSVH